jgi:hypothetical protein
MYKNRSILVVLIAAIALASCHNKNSSSLEPSFGFSIISPDSSGIHFANTINDVEEVTLFNNYYAYNGAGVAAGDINNDGLVDIMLIGNQVQSQLFLNKGDFIFEDITALSNIDVSSNWATGVSMVDLNDDGFLDIYICRSGPYSAEKRQNLLYINNGDLSFTERAKSFGLADQGPSTQANFFDIDLDGDLDMYLLNHPLEFDNAFNFYFYSNKDSIDPLYGDKIYIQEAGGFVDKSKEMGLETERGFGLSTSIMDFNGDSYPDIYVANDFLEPDYLWINTGSKVSNEIVEYFDKSSFYSMGSSIGDVNNDGLFDLLVVDMAQECHLRRKTADLPMSIDYYMLQEQAFGIPQYKHNMMYLQAKTGQFHDVSEYAGLSRTDWSWSPLLADFDNDGLEDALIINGIKRDIIDLDHVKNVFKNDAIVASKMSSNPIAMIESLPRRISENVFYKNQGAAKFENVNEQWLPNFNSNGQGAALADFDNDGRIDIIINNSDTTAFLIKNKLPVEPALRLSFSFQKGNLNGIGAYVKIFYKGGKVKLAQNHPTKGYYSSSQNAIFVSNQNELDSIQVFWPNGKATSVQEDFSGLPSYVINYSDSKPNDWESASISQDLPPYKLLSNHQIHKENKFPDFKLDKLAYRLHSQEGPSLAVADINQDGLQDFVLCAAKGVQSELCYQEGDGSFNCQFIGLPVDSVFEDISVSVLDLDNDGDLDLYFGSGSLEYYKPEEENKSQDRIYLNEDGKFVQFNSLSQLDIVPEFSQNLLAFDITGDGIKELISLPRYDLGNGLDGHVLTFKNGMAEDITSQYFPEFKGLGMVTDAALGDIDSDGDQDLIIVGEWMSVSIFRNNGDIFQKEALPDTQGWWESVVLTDIDGDDDLDIIAGNHGENSIFKASPSEPISLYNEEVNNLNKTYSILSHYLCGEEAPFLTRDQLCNAIPELYNNFPDYQSYGEAGMQGIVDLNNLQSEVKRAVELRSMYFLNEGNGFKAVPLPREAQMGPIKAILSNDFNGDNCMDILIAGNSNNEFYEYGSILALAPSILFGDCLGNLSYNTKSALGIPMKYTTCMSSIIIGVDNNKVLLIGNNNDSIQSYPYPSILDY